jgi:hypothetical protein
MQEMTLEKKHRTSGSLTGAAGVHFVVGELSRLGYVSLSTVRNTQGVDVVVSSSDFLRTVYVQVKTNSKKYDFWIVGKPELHENLFYVFVNLLSHQQNQRPEYYVVPSKEVYAKFQDFKNSKTHENLTDDEKEKVVELIKAHKPTWRINEELHVAVGAIRKIAQERNLKISYDRGKGESFPFCFYIRKGEEDRSRNRWELLFPAGEAVM